MVVVITLLVVVVVLERLEETQVQLVKLELEV
jgi:hypothetical protein